MYNDNITETTEKKKVENHVYEQIKEHFGIEIADKPNWVISPNDSKKPINYDTGEEAKWSQPKERGTLEQVCTSKHLKAERIPGLVLTPDLELVCIDLDHCLDEQDNLSTIAREFHDKLDSLTFKSRSGKGLHIYIKGKLPPEYSTKPSQSPGIEVYQEKKVMGCTGIIYGKTKPIREATAALQAILDTKPGFKKENIPLRDSHSVTSPPMSDEEIITRGRTAKNSPKFIKLLDEGNREDYKNDESTADFGLCSILSFYTQNPEQIERIIRRSHYYETKDEKHKEKWERTDYVQKTIARVLNGHKDTYCPTNQSSRVATSETTQVQNIKDSLQKISHFYLEDTNPCEGMTLQGYPEVLQEQVNSLRKVSDASLPMLLSSSIACASAYARHTYVQYCGTKLYPNLYKLVLAKSGAFKSTALELGCHAAYLLEKKITRILKEELQQAKTMSDSKTQKEAQEKALIKRANNSRLLANRTTAERLFRDLSLGQKGLLAASEYGGLLSTMEASYNNTLRATLTELYDCPPFYEVKTKGNENEPIIIENPYISILGFSAPEWLEGQISDKDIMKGFFSRYMIFYTNEPFVRPKPFPEKSFTPSEKWLRVLEKIEKCSGEYELSEGAKEAFSKIFHSIYDIHDEHIEDTDLLLPFVKRWCPQLLKLALLFHLMETPDERRIEAKQVVSAGNYLQYAIKSTLYVLKSSLLQSEFQRNCTALLSFIAKKGGAATRKEILTSRKLKITKGDDNKDAYDKVLNELVERGQIVFTKAHNNNNSTYSLNPEYHAG